jgi:hypothetical protein
MIKLDMPQFNKPAPNTFLFTKFSFFEVMLTSTCFNIWISLKFYNLHITEYFYWSDDVVTVILWKCFFNFQLWSMPTFWKASMYLVNIDFFEKFVLAIWCNHVFLIRYFFVIVLLCLLCEIKNYKIEKKNLMKMHYSISTWTWWCNRIVFL